MKKEIKTSIKTLTESACNKDVKADEALKLSQSALNIAHVLQILQVLKQVAK